MRTIFSFPHDALCAYLEDKANCALRDELIGMAIPVVERVALMIVYRKSAWLPQHVDGDELVSEGLMKLTPVVEEFDPPLRDNLSKAFYFHVAKRIYWRLLDYIRAERLISRSTMDHALRFKTACESLRRETGYAPMLTEIAKKLGISVAVAEEWRVSALELDVRNDSIDRQFSFSSGGHKSVSLHDVLVAPERETPEEQDARFTALLPPSLSDIERAIVISVYRDNKTMVEIGSAFSLSESRISQMFSDILPRIRAAYFERLRRESGDYND